MAAVTIDTGAQNSYYSSGSVGWSARSLFAYRTAIQLLNNSGTTGSWGRTTANPEIAQSFTTIGAIDVSDIRMVMTKTASPTDNLSLEIYSDTGANLPNASIATAANVYNGAAVSTTPSWLEFNFSTAVSLSASTKYWFVIKRSGAVDNTNYFSFHHNTSSAYAGGGRSVLNAGVWAAESSTDDILFQILTETPSALYAITQSTEPALHAWKSTDGGATWNEQDTSNNPTVTNANYPYDACDTRSGPYIGTAYFTATNTLRGRAFNMSTDTWGTEWNSADATTGATNERSIRVSLDNTFTTATHGSQIIHHTSSADDADLQYTRRTTSTWSGSTTVLAATSAEASMISDVVVDKSPIGFQQRFYYDCANDDFIIRSMTATTQGSAVALDASAADVETEHASSTFQIYQASNVDKIIAAYIDADGSIEERTATLEVTSASVTLGTQHAVGTATTTAGRQLSTCEYDGDLYVVANVSGTGITYYIDAGAAGSWDSGTAWKTGLTACTLSQALNVPGLGLAVIYTDNGDVKIEWIAVAGGAGATGTISSGTLSVGGQSITATTGVVGAVATGSLVVSGQAVAGTASAPGTVNTGSHTVSGQSITATASAPGTVNAGSLAVAGQAITATTGVVATVATGSHVVSGQSIAGTASAPGTVNTGSLSVAGQTVAATTGVVAAIASGTLAVAGQTISGVPTVAGNVSTGSLAVAGQTVNATTGVVATIAAGAHTVAGQAITADPAVLATIATGILTTHDAYHESDGPEGGSSIGFGRTSPGYREFAIPFTPSSNENLYGIELRLGVEVGIPTDYLYVEIRDDNSGEPGSLLYESSQISGGSLPSYGFDETALQRVTLGFDGDSLSISTLYWIVVRRQTLVPNGSPYYILGADSTAISGSHALGKNFAGAWVDVGTAQFSLRIYTTPRIVATTGVVAQITTGAYAVSGQDITGDEVGGGDDTGTVATGTIAVTGQTVSASTGTAAQIATGSLSVSGQTVNATTGVTANVSSGSLTVSGQAVSGTYGATGNLTTGTLVVTGGAVSASTGVVGIIGTGGYAVTGQGITSSYDVVAVITTGELAVTGQAITALEFTGQIPTTATFTITAPTATFTASNPTATLSANRLAASFDDDLPTADLVTSGPSATWSKS